MTCKERCPLCGCRDSPKLTEDEIASVLKPQWFDDNRAKIIAQALITAGFGFKDALPAFSFDDGDVVNDAVPGVNILPGEVRRIEIAFRNKYPT